MNVLSTLKKLKTSADFAGAIDTLEADHAEAVAAVGELEGKREDLIFTGGDLAKLERDIVEAEGRVKTLAIAISGAERRRTEAAEAERMAEMVAVGNEAKKQTATLRKALAAFEETAAELAKDAENVTALRREIATLNAKLREGNRADLAARDPIKQQARDADRQITEPLAGLVIAGHWPQRRPFIAPLAKAG